MSFVLPGSGADPINVETTFRADPARVFRAFTEPAEVTKWFGSQSGDLESVAIDLRPGGDWRFTERTSAAGSVGFEGEYIEVESDKRLVFSWSKFSENAAGHRDSTQRSRVEVRFAPISDGTRLTIVHSAIEDARLRDDFAGGWTRALPSLASVVSPAGDLHELALEATIGGLGVDTDDRHIPVISLANADARRAEITDQLWAAAADVGFFQLADHGIPPALVDRAFAAADAFFALPDSVKAAYPWKRELNAGWESRAQVRPSTRVADQKESFQMTRPNMEGLWPTEAEVPSFAADLLALEAAAWEVAMSVLSCFADRLGFDTDFFHRAHDPDGDGYQSTVRLLHYFPMTGDDVTAGQWRAGAHTDYDCLTLLFQRDGQDGLQVCPGQDAQSGRWTSVVPNEDLITCNIGDMLMRWSDDQLRSTLHRVRGPQPGDVAGSRHSVAFFAQANKPVMIESPTDRFEPLTAEDYLQRRINANFDA